MSQKILNHSIFISNNVRHDLLLLAVDQKLNNFAEVAGKYRIDWLFAWLGLDEFKEAIKKHVFAELLIIGFLRTGKRRGLSLVLFNIRLLKGRLLFWRVSFSCIISRAFSNLIALLNG